MLRLIVLSLVVCAFCAIVSGDVYIYRTGPKYLPTEGEVWPQPQGEKKKQTYYQFSPSQFKINVTNEKCPILGHAIVRFIAVLKDLFSIARRNRRNSHQRSRAKRSKDSRFKGFIRELQLSLKEPCEDYPHFKMDESYGLTVGSTAVLSSDSVWGMLRGLETVAQLFYFTSDYSEIRINGTEIFDFPYYFHRGLLLDTSRHFISVANILKTLDAMAINKLNVFHWHIVDDQSFPYESEIFPEFSKKGAYHPSMVYKKSDIQMIVEYARNRGIRVLPEFDVPGHTRSWGNSHPEILTPCYIQNHKTKLLGPLNPLRKRTYKIMQQLYQEVQQLFPDRYMHIGGDEVNLDCWKSNPDIKNFMTKKNVSSIYEVHATFMHRIIQLLGQRSTPIVWQEVYDNDVPLPKDAIVQIWKSNYMSQMVEAIKENVQVVFSASWYLDYSDNTFTRLYRADPRSLVRNKVKDNMLENIVGGEACMWGEKVDDRNLFSKVWPRACAVAEVLWSVTDGVVPARGHRRMEEHTCRMIRRGVPAAPPSGPGYCVT